MRYQDIAKLSTRMFKTNPARTWLTILGMGVGTGAVVVLVGLGFGLQQILLDTIVGGDTLLSLNVANPVSRAVVLNKRSVDELRKLDNIKDVAPLASFPALITFEGLTGNANLQGVSPAYFRYAGVHAVAGELFKEKEPDSASAGSVIVTKAVLKLFEVKDPAKVIGKKVTFRVFVPKEGSLDKEEIVLTKEYKIIGVSNEENFLAAILTLPELQSHIAVTTYDKAQVRVSAIEFLDSAQKSVVGKGFNVTALSKTVDQANKIFTALQAILAAFGGIALTVSAIGMFNTMTVTLLERTGEIGVMRTLGASSGDIKILFVTEAVIVGILGGVVGILIGVGIGFSVNGMMNLAASKFGGKAVSLFVYPLPFLGFITAFSGIVGFLTGVFPARRAASLNPLDAIRYK